MCDVMERAVNKGKEEVREEERINSIKVFINDNLNMYINDHLRMYTSDYALI